MPSQAAAQRLEFAPPPEPGQGRAFSLALLAHLLLVGALTWGISWNRESREITAEAELWSATVQQAAPALAEPPPPPPPPPPQNPAPVKPPPPAPPRVAEPPAPAKDADIALAREKEREKRREKLAQAQAEKAEQAAKAAKARQEKERLRKEKAEAEKKAAEKKLADKKAAELKAKQEAAERKRGLAEKAEREQRLREEAEAQRLAQQRDENLKRMQGLAGASGAPTSTGTAQKSSGPSDSYGGRIRAKVRPNIVFTEDIPGNPVAEVEVKMAPDGTIISQRITKSSGVKAWDEAVLRALIRTEVLPRDLDGRVHSPLLMEFKPKGL